jgi:hypothetical protein
MKTMKSVLIYAIAVGVIGAIASYKVATRLAGPKSTVPAQV